MKLSPHFDLAEFTNSQTASRLHLDNTPDADTIARLKMMAEALEKVRTFLGGPLSISSGYRSKAVNHAVGSSDTSAHIKGYAADFICPSFGTPLAICRALAKVIEFDQLIEEGTWVHLSFDPRMRGEVLTMRDGHYLQGLAA